MKECEFTPGARAALWYSRNLKMSDTRVDAPKMFREMDGVELKFDEDALERVADLAIERKTGARGLRAILEDVMLDIMFDIPSRSDIKSCTITKDVIEKKAPPVFGYRKQKEQLPPPELGDAC